jgi:hypothetical protein
MMQPYQQQQPQKKGTSPVVIVLAILGGAVVLGFAGCVVCVGVGAKAVAHQAEKEQTAKQEAKETAKADVMKVAARDIIEAYKGNEVKADNTYKGKYVEVSGIAASVAKDIMDHPYVTVGTGGEFEVVQVQCTFSEKASAAAAEIVEGEKLTVRGHVNGKLMNVLLGECEVVEAEETPSMTICRTLEAAGTATNCKASSSKSDKSTTIFKTTSGKGGGAISIYDSEESFADMVKALEKRKSKYATSKYRAVVFWESDDAAIDKKIRDTVTALKH